MPGEIRSFDNVYLAVDQGDKNFVVYDTTTDPWTAVWDRWSHEANSGNPSIPISPIPDTPVPIGPDSPMIPSKPMKLIENSNPIGMSYWRNINYHAGRSSFMVALSIGDRLKVLTVAKNNLVVMDDKSLGIAHTGEGIFFSVSRHDILYVPLDNALIAVNVYTGDRKTIWEVEGGQKLWQIHSNYNENIHSATLRNNEYQPVGWGVFNGAETKVFPIRGTPDECQIDKSGEWLLIKEDNDNRIIHIASGEEKIVHNQEGAIGHSDNGFGCTLGENDYSPKPGALDLIDFPSLRKMNMYSTGIWNMGYCSFTNAKPGPIAEQFCLVTTPDQLIKVNLDGSGVGTIVCPNLTQSQEYEHRPKANLCPLGEYAVWTAFVDGAITAFVVRVP